MLHWEHPFRMVLAATLVAAGLLLLAVAHTTIAANPTCAPGYLYEPWMGIDCIQAKLPPHGKISYTGEAMCEDGYMAVYGRGPSEYGSDPNATYLVACLTAAEASSRAAASAAAPASAALIPTPSAASTGPPSASSPGPPAVSGNDPIDNVANAVVEGGSPVPDTRDTGMAGLTATGLLLLTIGGSIGLAAPPTDSGGGDTGGSGSGGGGPAETAATADDKAALTRRRDDLLKLDGAIARSLAKVTADTNPDNWNSADVAELLSDVAGIAALAPALTVPAGAVSLASGVWVEVANTYSPRETIEQMRHNLGQLSYLRGVLQADLTATNARLEQLDKGAAAGISQPPAPTDLSGLTDAQLTVARDLAAARADAALGDAIKAQEDLIVADGHRRDIGHAIDTVRDQLDRLNQPTRLNPEPLPSYTADALATGGASAALDAAGERLADVAAGQRMDAHFQAQAMQLSADGLKDAEYEAKAVAARGESVGALGGHAGGAGAAAGILSGEQWAADRMVDGGRALVHQSLAQLEFKHGHYDARASRLRDEISALHQRADEAVAARRAISAELENRAIASGHILWR